MQSFWATSFDRPNGKVSTVLYVANDYGLASPPGTFRNDEITTASLTQNYHYDAGTNTITSNGTGGAVTGHVTVQSGTGTTGTTQYTCVRNGSKMSENIQLLQTNTTYTNGAPPLTAHFLTDGALKFPNGGVATTTVIGIWTFS